ncbi:MAG: hypothetical protein WC205_16845 [Opitutaceae bacterium]|jgi:hypothetical protein
MQIKSESFGEFSARTDRLAAHLRVNVSELTGVIRLSNGMLFAYRKGKHPISPKAWSKLESAEVAAGIQTQSQGGQSQSQVVASTPAGTAFGDYLKFIRACREEAERLGGDDTAAKERIFDKLLATFMSAKK